MKIRARAEYRLERDAFAVTIAVGDHVMEPVEMRFTEMDPYVAVEPSFYVSQEIARELYDALGQALGFHLSDTKLAGEILKTEQQRVNQLINYITQERP